MGGSHGAPRRWSDDHRVDSFRVETNSMMRHGNNYWKGIFIWIGAVLGAVRGSAPARPQTCPYRPLISYKIGQMPTITRGG